MVTLSGDMGPGLVMSHNLVTHYSCDHTQVNIIHHYTFQIIVHIEITVFRNETYQCIKALLLKAFIQNLKQSMIFKLRNIYFWPLS